MLQPVYTMHGTSLPLRDLKTSYTDFSISGFNWFDRRGTEGVGFIRALRTLLTSNLPKILPDLSCIIKTRFRELHAEHAVVDGTDPVKRKSVFYADKDHRKGSLTRVSYNR